jgi:hypothetical protein
MNVTYLLGAGASSYCLPTYANFRQRFSEFTELFRNNRAIYSNLGSQYKNTCDILFSILNSLNEEFKFHNTPDTIAKKYFHKYGKDSIELKRLKEILILFFIHQQTIDKTEFTFKNIDGSNKDLIDKRYDAFIASLLKPIPNRVELLEKFKILTWNYDLQFEKAFLNYELYGIETIQEKIQSIPRVNGNTDFSNLDNTKFSIVHLNGIAYAKPLERIQFDKFSLFHENDTDALKYLLDIYKSLHTTEINKPYIGGESLLNFAWENQQSNYSLSDNDLIKSAMKIARETEILVINGYSFPVFNNPVDTEILGQMLELKKVYVQSPQAKEIIKFLKDYYLRNSGHLRSESIIDLEYWHQFHIPTEWRS